jgi:hypothetical protein
VFVLVVVVPIVVLVPILALVVVGVVGVSSWVEGVDVGVGVVRYMFVPVVEDGTEVNG